MNMDGAKEMIKSDARPFVKWVGGKRSIIGDLQSRFPEKFTAYYENFLGGGALFFATQPSNAYLSDTNIHLISSYIAIRDDVEAVIDELRVHKAAHSKPYFLNARKMLILEDNSAKKAGLFIYLNKTCFNGLFRVNKAGEFNVPMGDYKNPAILDEVNLRAVSHALQGAKIYQHGFESTPVEKGAFYYLDPPYHETYSGYASAGFGDDAHRELAAFCRRIDAAGGYFMLSNSDTAFIREIYDGFTIETVSAMRSVSSKSSRRGREDECVIRNYDERR